MPCEFATLAISGSAAHSCVIIRSEIDKGRFNQHQLIDTAYFIPFDSSGKASCIPLKI
jgi:hypothetical protein